MHQKPDQLRQALPGFLIPIVAPTSGKRLARLPRHRLPADGRSLLDLELLRGHEVPAVLSVHQIQPVVHDDRRLQPAREPHEFDGIPIPIRLAVLRGLRREIIPDDVDLPVLGQEFRDLGEQQQAEWHMRDVLISLANDFNLISIGLLFDCTNGYYNHFYGGSGIINRAPYVYPKRAYVAYAALTSALDTVKFVRQIPTGSTTVYALEFKKADGTYAYAFWSARGAFELTLDNSKNSNAVLTEFYGKTQVLKGATVQVNGGTAPVYLCTKNPLKSLQMTKRSFPEEAARAAKAKPGSSFDDVALVTMEPDPMITSTHTDFLPINKPGKFSIANVNDPEKGKAISVTLDLSSDPYKSNYITEFTTIRLKEPVVVNGNPKAVGVWIKGNSSWGQVRFEIEDAQGEIFKGITTTCWGCDIYDWPGNTCLNFDGWCYVAQPLFPSSLFCNHSPGPASEQWVSCGGDKKIDLPIKVRAVTIGMYRNTLDLLDFKKIAPTVLLKDFGGIEE